MDEPEKVSLATPCGLYCGICMMYLDGKCHGCGCGCGNCLSKVREKQCGILQCVHSRKIESCAQCDELPCTRLIQFTVDPIWRTHAPCIENLHRRKKIGTDMWLAEQETHFQDQLNRRRWLDLFQECFRRHQEEIKSSQ